MFIFIMMRFCFTWFSSRCISSFLHDTRKTDQFLSYSVSD
jgi:hypothetical protein